MRVYKERASQDTSPLVAAHMLQSIISRGYGLHSGTSACQSRSERVREQGPKRKRLGWHKGSGGSGQRHPRAPMSSESGLPEHFTDATEGLGRGGGGVVPPSKHMTMRCNSCRAQKRGARQQPRTRSTTKESVLV